MYQQINLEMFSKVFFLFSLIYVTNIESAKILGIYTLPSYSHYILGKTLFKALAEKGHEVTVIGTYPLKTPIRNYEDIYTEDIITFKEDGLIKMVMEAENGTLVDKLMVTQNVIMKTTELCLGDPKVQKLLSADRNFDLVIMDWVMNDALLGFGYRYKAPTIVISSFGSSFFTNKITGNPTPLAYVPSNFFTNSDNLSFFERVANVLSETALLLANHLLIEPEQQRLISHYFPDAPPLQELIRNISLVFLNSHYAIETPRPFLPNMIQIGGLHLHETEELSADLKKFLDEAKEGVLYFSLGSNVKSSDLKENQLNVIVRTLSKLPLRVLWKFDIEIDVPKNVKIAKWFPQPAILAHPNVRVFVTHGGIFSMIEAVHYGVPIVGIPCFFDQVTNVDHGVRLGHAIKVPLEELTEEAFTNAINEILEKPKYRQNIQERSKWLQDRPMKPLDTAMYWVEYVLKHKGAHHLKATVLNLPWYQYFLLDVFAFFAVVFIVIYFALCSILKWTKNLIFGPRRKGKSKSTKIPAKLKSN